MRIIARRERPHPGAQLRLADHDGWGDGTDSAMTDERDVVTTVELLSIT